MITSERISITYMYSLAFFTCDCGKEMVSHTFDNSLYQGNCTCGLKWEIRNGMIHSHCPHCPQSPQSLQN